MRIHTEVGDRQNQDLVKQFIVSGKIPGIDPKPRKRRSLIFEPVIQRRLLGFISEVESNSRSLQAWNIVLWANRQEEIKSFGTLTPHQVRSFLRHFQYNVKRRPDKGIRDECRDRPEVLREREEFVRYVLEKVDHLPPDCLPSEGVPQPLQDSEPDCLSEWELGSDLEFDLEFDCDLDPPLQGDRSQEARVASAAAAVSAPACRSLSSGREVAAKDEKRKKFIFYFHDETTIHVHDVPRSEWVRKGRAPSPLPKSMGPRLMISGFTCSCHKGLTSLRFRDGGPRPSHEVDNSHWQPLEDWAEISTDEPRQRTGKDSYKILAKRFVSSMDSMVVVESGGDTWFTADDVEKQFKRALLMHESLHPGSIAIFVFDNAPTHKASPDGALNAKKMTLKPSERLEFTAGRFMKTVDGVLKEVKQEMMEETADGVRRFRGLKAILEERGLQPAKWRLQTAMELLSKQPDFKVQKNKLQTVLGQHNVEKKTEHEIIYLPRFHPDLNPIERVWANIKAEWRKTDGDRGIQLLRGKVVTLVETVSVSTLQRYFLHCLKLMKMYSMGPPRGVSQYKFAVWAAKKYSSHRTTPTETQWDDIMKEYSQYVENQTKAPGEL